MAAEARRPISSWQLWRRGRCSDPAPKPIASPSSRRHLIGLDRPASPISRKRTAQQRHQGKHVEDKPTRVVHQAFALDVPASTSSNISMRTPPKKKRRPRAAATSLGNLLRLVPIQGPFDHDPGLGGVAPAHLDPTAFEGTAVVFLK